MRVPIACTLEVSDARLQIGEWQAALRQLVVDVERASANRLEFILKPGSNLGAVVTLAQREVTCCTFFTFTVVIGVERLVLAVEVPDDAIEILDQLEFDVQQGW